MTLLRAITKACFVSLIAIFIYIIFQTSTVRIENHVFISAEIPTVYTVFANPRLHLSLHGVKMDLIELSEKDEHGVTVQKYMCREFVPILFGYGFTNILNVTTALLKNEMKSNVSVSSALISFTGNGRFAFMEFEERNGERGTHVQDVLHFELPRLFHWFVQSTGTEAHLTLLRNVKDHVENNRNTIV